MKLSRLALIVFSSIGVFVLSAQAEIVTKADKCHIVTKGEYSNSEIDATSTQTTRSFGVSSLFKSKKVDTNTHVSMNIETASTVNSVQKPASTTTPDDYSAQCAQLAKAVNAS